MGVYCINFIVCNIISKLDNKIAQIKIENNNAEPRAEPGSASNKKKRRRHDRMD